LKKILLTNVPSIVWIFHDIQTDSSIASRGCIGCRLRFRRLDGGGRGRPVHAVTKHERQHKHPDQNEKYAESLAIASAH
jgi:hypothetical protein